MVHAFGVSKRRSAASGKPTVITVGAFSAKVYFTPVLGRPRFTLAWADPSRGRVRETFAGFDLARNRAEEVAGTRPVPSEPRRLADSGRRTSRTHLAAPQQHDAQCLRGGCEEGRSEVEGERPQAFVRVLSARGDSRRSPSGPSSGEQSVDDLQALP